jgi:hypothetical protein
VSCTYLPALQVHQPQRFIDPLWRLLAAMEAELGCLVGEKECVWGGDGTGAQAGVVIASMVVCCSVQGWVAGIRWTK